MSRSVPYRVAAWVVLFAAGIACGYALRERRAAQELEADALIRGLERASQAQMTLLMISENRATQLQPVLERQLATEIRTAHQALSAGTMRLPSALPSLSDAMRRSGAYLAQHGGPKDVVEKAVWVSDRLKEGR